MSGALREWLLSLTGAAAVCALAGAMCPAGRVKKVLGVICGMVMALAFMSPLLELDFDAYAAALSRYGQGAERAALEGEAAQNSLNRTIIQEECAAYILDKAEALGMTGAVEVLAVWSGEDSVWYPYEARLSLKGDGRSALSDAIAAELGIPAERQYWEE